MLLCSIAFGELELRRLVCKFLWILVSCQGGWWGLIWVELSEVYFCPLQLAVGSLFSSFLSMQKTKKSVAKRFKLTSTGKLVRRTPGFRHLLASKSTKQKRRASRDKLVAEGHAKPLKRCLPFGL